MRETSRGDIGEEKDKDKQMRVTSRGDTGEEKDRDKQMRVTSRGDTGEEKDRDKQMSVTSRGDIGKKKVRDKQVREKQRRYKNRGSWQTTLRQRWTHHQVVPGIPRPELNLNCIILQNAIPSIKKIGPPKIFIFSHNVVAGGGVFVDVSEILPQRSVVKQNWGVEGLLFVQVVRRIRSWITALVLHPENRCDYNIYIVWKTHPP